METDIPATAEILADSAPVVPTDVYDPSNSQMEHQIVICTSDIVSDAGNGSMAGHTVVVDTSISSQTPDGTTASNLAAPDNETSTEETGDHEYSTITDYDPEVALICILAD